MNEYFADLHVHVGRSGDGRPVKISAAAGMTVEAVLQECQNRKGIDIVAVVDCGSPGVQADIVKLLDDGTLDELPGGGLQRRSGPVLIPAMEVEIGADGAGPAHYVGYFPDLAAVVTAGRRLSNYVTNIQLSTQRARLSARELFTLVEDNGGLFMPAHVFTPHRGFYGACARRLPDVFGDAAEHIHVVELGLSADTDMADRIEELGRRTFLSSSDAHSLPKIAREYTVLELAEPTFSEFVLAMKGDGGRRVGANYGLEPRLGKYHRSGCVKCERIATEAPPVDVCPACGSERIVKGVLDRLTEVADWTEPRSPDHRPPYIHQVPLQFVPGVGPRTLQKLLDEFGSEMAVLHRATAVELADCVGTVVAERIMRAREGTLAVQSGGGGTYGRVRVDSATT